MAALRVGIDFSLSSPALYARDCDEKYYILCFQQRKTDVEISNLNVGQNTYLWRKPYPLDEEFRWEKVVYIIHEVFSWLDLIRNGKPVKAYIENYAFNMGGGKFGSSSVTKLAELGGILRAELWKRRWEFKELAITSIKLQFAGSGKAEKYEMAHTFQCLGFPNGIRERLQCEYHQHPLEDVVDAAAVLITGLVFDKA
jgi:Holliday junction resolvasome RuvABC endonuclease subunit